MNPQASQSQPTQSQGSRPIPSIQSIRPPSADSRRAGQPAAGAIQPADSLAPAELESIQRMIMDDFGNDPGNLIMILQAINGRYKYLPQSALRRVSMSLGLPLSRIYGIATFYKAFSLEPRGAHTIKICVGTACHVRGAGRLKERLEETLHVREGQTTADRRFTLETVRCVGCCGLGPVVMIDEDTYSRTDSQTVIGALDHYAG
ncbi:MAG: NAD(P)H-dependent oxidoreductase subunit E [Desulfococcaceae bacterium]